MEILDQDSITEFIETSGDEGTTIREIFKSKFSQYDESILSAFSYLIDGKKADLDDKVFPGNDLKVIPMIAGGFN